ncbi:P-loop NTPase fold protein [Isoptericola sp. NPDC057391]|uniref:KAP family P-loop NTPase fold protein n=1 Tax=Isoptericola sp. NPDC057391 TaxID=3346117 RepID=UPI0036383C38
MLGHATLRKVRGDEVVWSDNETDRDLLNFQGVADTVAEFILQANGAPISVGVSGAWGVGKSTMIQLTRAALEEKRHADDPTEFVFVEFNAWLYQGYDDARAALLDVIAVKLEAVAEERKSGADKVKEFMRRVKWLRLAKLVALPAAAVALGIPPVGLGGEIAEVVRDVRDGAADGEQIESVGSALAAAGAGLLKPGLEMSPPKEIQALRDSFEETLEAIGVTLVVLIDDLDRCLPETAISTLEAIRLLLFLQNTAFVIAADDEMIKRAVKKHFGGLDDDELVTNYFDKLIQVPIKVPALGIQEVRAYMMMLFIDDSTELDIASKNTLRTAIAAGLRESWKGVRVDGAFVSQVDDQLPAALVTRLETAERLAPLMTGATHIVGNPRLIKRFLNALSIRMSIARAQGVDVDEAVLAKLLLFERVVEAPVFVELATKVNEDPDGRPTFLGPWEAAVAAGAELELPKGWDTAFARDWLGLEPELAGIDLRGALYVGREQAPLVTGSDKLSAAAVELLTALTEYPREAPRMKDDLAALPSVEQGFILDRLLAIARPIQSWGSPPILDACLTMASIDPAWGQKLARFLVERPQTQISASVVPKIAGQEWSSSVFSVWKQAEGIKAPVKNAIAERSGSGNLTK